MFLGFSVCFSKERAVWFLFVLFLFFNKCVIDFSIPYIICTTSQSVLKSWSFEYVVWTLLCLFSFGGHYSLLLCEFSDTI